MKKILTFVFSSFLLLSFSVSPLHLSAEGQKETTIYFFWGEGCPHCAAEEIFLKTLGSKYPNLEIKDFEIWHNAANRNLVAELGQKLNLKIDGVPFTIIGDQTTTGYFDDETTGKWIEDWVKYYSLNGDPDIIGEILNQKNEPPVNSDAPPNQAQLLEKIKLPIFGEINIKNLSLPFLTLILGGIDGFNPCAMWILLLLISFLLGMKNRKKMWILGSAFIITSALVYFFFMAAWLNFVMFLGMIFWIRIGIGLVALTAGVFSLKKYFEGRKGTCEVAGDSQKKRIFERLESIFKTKSFWLALGGIMILAASVNLIELVCSAGLPVVYTQILFLNKLPVWQYYTYLLLYVFIFMLDDMLVFIAAMATLRITGAGTKYSRFSNLIGGLAMLAIGILLIFKPEWLMFG